MWQFSWDPLRSHCNLQALSQGRRADAGLQGGQGSAWLPEDGKEALDNEGLLPSKTRGFVGLSALVLSGITWTWEARRGEGS